jgi:hypothetical protein
LRGRRFSKSGSSWNLCFCHNKLGEKKGKRKDASHSGVERSLLSSEDSAMKWDRTSGWTGGFWEDFGQLTKKSDRVDHRNSNPRGENKLIRDREIRSVRNQRRIDKISNWKEKS